VKENGGDHGHIILKGIALFDRNVFQQFGLCTHEIIGFSVKGSQTLACISIV